MAGDDAALVVGMMMCFFSVVLSTGFSYTCTGGSFDPEDFDADQCFSLPEDDDSGGGGGGGGGSDGVNNNDPANNDPSPQYPECVGQFHNDITTTCFSSGSGIAGIRWSWLDNDAARTCRAKTYKYGIVVSSSQTSHRVKHRFPDIIGNMANSFAFSGAPAGFLPGQNIKFYITPLDVNDKKIDDASEYVLDVNNSREECNAHGTPVPFSQAVIIESEDARDPGSAPPPDPVPCSGDVYLPQSACIRNGIELNDPNDASRCGDGGFQTTLLDTEHPSYQAAQHGGVCEFSRSIPCSLPCNPSVPRTQKTQEMCDAEAFTYNQWVNSLGCVKDTGFDKRNPPTDPNSYTKITENCFPVGERDGIQATLAMEVSPDGYSCIPAYRWNACGKTECPKDCVGDWVDHPTPEERCCMPGGTTDRCADRSGDAPSVGREGSDGMYGIGLKKGKRQKYVVSPGQEANSTGSCPNLNKERWYLWNDERWTTSGGCKRPPSAGGANR